MLAGLVGRVKKRRMSDAMVGEMRVCVGFGGVWVVKT